MIYTDLIKINPGLENSEDIIRLLAGLLRDGGYVNNGFEEAVIQREKTSPTGLATGEGGFAIPHTDTHYVKKAAVALAVLGRPVRFGEMGNPENGVNVDIVAMLAIKEPDAVVPFLKEICGLFQDKTLVAGLHACDSPESVAEMLRERLPA